MHSFFVCYFLPSFAAQCPQPPLQPAQPLPDFLLFTIDLILKPTMTASTSNTIIVDMFIKFTSHYAALRFVTGIA